MLQVVPISLCKAAQSTWFYGAMGNYTNLFPAVETLHVLSMIVLVGAITAFDLRLLGAALRDVSVSRLAGRRLPATWTAFALMAVTGVLLFHVGPCYEVLQEPCAAIQAHFDFSGRPEHGCIPFHGVPTSGELDVATKMPLGLSWRAPSPCFCGLGWSSWVDGLAFRRGCWTCKMAFDALMQWIYDLGVSRPWCGKSSGSFLLWSVSISTA